MDRRPLIASSLSLGVCIACGGGSSGTSAPPADDESVASGRFIDSAVEGLDYETATRTGVTNANGEFRYVEGESVTFSIGSLDFPPAPAAPLVSPLDMQPASDVAGAVPVNVARLVQSLDLDGNPANGIVIPESAAAVATPLDFNVGVEAFESNPDVINLVANSGSSTTTLVSAEAARSHLEASLAAEANDALTLADLVGYWSVEDSLDTVEITAEGRISFFDYLESGRCHALQTGTVSPIEGPLFLVRTDDGDERQLIITREGEALNLLFVGTLVPITDSDPSSLTLCP